MECNETWGNAKSGANWEAFTKNLEEKSWCPFHMNGVLRKVFSISLQENNLIFIKNTEKTAFQNAQNRIS